MKAVWLPFAVRKHNLASLLTRAYSIASIADVDIVSLSDSGTDISNLSCYQLIARGNLRQEVAYFVNLEYFGCRPYHYPIAAAQAAR